MGGVSSLSVFVYIADEVLDSHLGGSISNLREAKAQFFRRRLYPFRGKNGEEAGGLSKRSVEYAIDLGELSFIEDSVVCSVTFFF